MCSSTFAFDCPSTTLQWHRKLNFRGFQHQSLSSVETIKRRQESKGRGNDQLLPFDCTAFFNPKQGVADFQRGEIAQNGSELRSPEEPAIKCRGWHFSGLETVTLSVALEAWLKALGGGGTEPAWS
jgi:hypothetical protein